MNNADEAKKLNEKARSFAANKKNILAGLYYYKSLALVPNDAFVLFNFGLLLSTTLQNEKAIQCFSKAIHLLPTFYEAYTNLGALFLKLSRNEEALECISISLSLNASDDNKESQFNMNTVLRRLGRHKESIQRVWKEMYRKIPPQRRYHIPVTIPLLYSHQSLQLGYADSQNLSNTFPESLTVVCVKWGNKYNSEYVNKLYRGVSKNLNIPFEFVCYTDDAEGVCNGIVVRDLPHGEWSGWWNKAFLFADTWCTKIKKSSRILYIDLDTVIVDDITELACYNESCFIIWGTRGLSNEGREGGYNSSIMSWRCGWGRYIYDRLCSLDFYVKKYIHRLDHWLEMLIPNAPLYQDVFINQCVEYMGVARDEIPLGARIISFPLDPKPHQVKGNKWIENMWI